MYYNNKMYICTQINYVNRISANLINPNKSQNSTFCCMAVGFVLGENLTDSSA